VKGLGATAVATAGLSHNRGFANLAAANGTMEIGIASTIVGGPLMAAGWALREYEVIGSDSPAEGLTASALQQQVYQTSLARESENASTFVDNQNILDGAKHTAYTDAKIAAIEALNAGVSESEVLSAANNAVDSYHTTVKSNLLKSWNASLSELDNMLSAVQSHPDLSLLPDMLPTSRTSDDVYGSGTTVGSIGSIGYVESDIDMPDGSTFTLKKYDVQVGGESPYITYSPVGHDYSGGDGWEIPTHEFTWTTSSGDVTYLDHGEWSGIYDKVETTFSDVRDGISTWVTTVYSDVQSGEIEISDLVTPRERAAMMAKEEGMSQAIADLVALNMPVDPDREATITIGDTGATLPGTFGLSDSSDGPIEAGTTYDPSTFTGDVYFTADMSLVEGSWDAYETAVDGGSITVTSEPYEGTAIEVTTAADETVTVPAADWTDNGDGTWSYDASGDLETNITEVVDARFHATATETSYETIKLGSQFTVDKLTNSDGESVDQTSFSSSEPQTDSNYITQEEWDQLEQQNQELIEKYENSQSGGSFSLDQFDFFGIPGEAWGLGVAALVAVGILN